jgi:hypothetical protein
MPQRAMVTASTTVDMAAAFLEQARAYVDEVRLARRQLSEVAARYSEASGKVVDMTVGSDTEQEREGTHE